LSDEKLLKSGDILQIVKPVGIVGILGVNMVDSSHEAYSTTGILKSPTGAVNRLK